MTKTTKITSGLWLTGIILKWSLQKTLFVYFLQYPLQYFISYQRALGILWDTNDEFIYVCIRERIHHPCTEYAIWIISAVRKQKKVIIMVINAGIWEGHCCFIEEERERITLWRCVQCVSLKLKWKEEESKATGHWINLYRESIISTSLYKIITLETWK